MASVGRYSCKSAAETLEWITAIVDFLKPHKPLMDAHVVNFFKDRLWELIDKEWMECLRKEPVENLLSIPSGIVQENWPASLQKFVLTVKSLDLPREQDDLRMMLPNLNVTPLSTVLAQGMSLKKKHEVETLSAIVNAVARSAGAQAIIDVGAGQGYLALVLSFQYQLSVAAIDSSSHHGNVTSVRADRIKKHYVAKMHRTGLTHVHVPQTITCNVLSTEMLKDLSSTLSRRDYVDLSDGIRSGLDKPCDGWELNSEEEPSCNNRNSGLVLTGLHACGDLSITMLRTFAECEEIKAVVSVGCCYNLLTEEGAGKTRNECGFPLSGGVKSIGLYLGKSARDLACQSAERWSMLTKDIALQNFKLHSFRAAFQMVLFRYHPEVLAGSPSIGRQGKAMRRRQQQRKAIQDHLDAEQFSDSPSASEQCSKMEKGRGVKMGWHVMFLLGQILRSHDQEIGTSYREFTNPSDLPGHIVCSGQLAKYVKLQSTVSMGVSSDCTIRREQTKSLDRFSTFKQFCCSGLGRLGLTVNDEVDYFQIWSETEGFAELVGPFWSIRAALGPVVETLLLLDRLLFLQEHGNLAEAVMLPIFNPRLSPRNVVILAQKV
ncbi:hypothetical protein Sjap_026241 [Stephania japonica]|uniref:Methyltransferase domain-containing protein n=1 Tax=Stephania japonica TaxID=461633 RepID=A0AAP0HK94_9MAGN